MSAGRYDLEIEQGSDFVLNILYQDTNDVALDLGTYTARMQIRESSDSSSSIIELTNANSRITLGAVDPNIVLTLVRVIQHLWILILHFMTLKSFHLQLLYLKFCVVALN